MIRGALLGSLSVASLVLSGCIPAADASPPEPGTAGVPKVRPTQPVMAVALLRTGDGGWSAIEPSLAAAMAKGGIARLAIDTDHLLAEQAEAKAKCLSPDTALNRLAAGFEHRLGLADDRRPMLVGFSAGASAAFGALMQAPQGTWTGAVSLGFSPEVNGPAAGAVRAPERRSG